MTRLFAPSETTAPEPKCELCGRPINKWTIGTLKGLCGNCCDNLGGGKHSCKIVKAEAQAMRGGK